MLLLNSTDLVNLRKFDQHASHDKRLEDFGEAGRKSYYQRDCYSLTTLLDPIGPSNSFHIQESSTIKLSSLILLSTLLITPYKSWVRSLYWLG